MYGTVLYRERHGEDWVPAEVIGHLRGLPVLREVGRLWPGVWVAQCGQVRIPVEPRAPKPMGRPKRWAGERLEAIRRDYVAGMPMAEIAAIHGIPPDTLRGMPRRKGWPRRPHGRPKLPNSVRTMLPEQRRLYRKLQPHVGREAALAEALR